jgi:hypothetical protein
VTPGEKEAAANSLEPPPFLSNPNRIEPRLSKDFRSVKETSSGLPRPPPIRAVGARPSSVSSTLSLDFSPSTAKFSKSHTLSPILDVSEKSPYLEKQDASSSVVGPTKPDSKPEPNLAATAATPAVGTTAAKSSAPPNKKKSGSKWSDYVKTFKTFVVSFT